MKTKRISRRTAFAGIFSAAAAAVSAAENALPPVPFLPPGAKLGLSNILVMFIALEIGLPTAFAVVCFKAVLALIMRRATAAVKSHAGGVLSVLAVYALSRSRHIGCIGLGVAGAVMHNLGQLCVSLIIAGGAAIYYMPPLLLYAVASGIITGIALYRLLPPMCRALNGGYMNE